MIFYRFLRGLRGTEWQRRPQPLLPAAKIFLIDVDATLADELFWAHRDLRDFGFSIHVSKAFEEFSCAFAEFSTKTSGEEKLSFHEYVRAINHARLLLPTINKLLSLFMCFPPKIFFIPLAELALQLFPSFCLSNVDSEVKIKLQNETYSMFLDCLLLNGVKFAKVIGKSGLERTKSLRHQPRQWPRI